MAQRTALAALIALAATTVFADNIQLASLSSVDGKVLVNQGHGFVAAKPGMVLGDGDRVIALDGSHAAVVYSDGCVSQLKENTLLAMDKALGCKKDAVGTGGADQMPVRYAQAIGAPPQQENRKRGGGMDLSSPPPVVSHSYIPVLVFGGLATGAMLSDTFHNHGHNNPISPQ